MAKAQAIAQRNKTVGNIKKITHTMQLIATARFQRALSHSVGARPYTEKIGRLVQQLSAAGAQVDHPLLRLNEEGKRDAALLITSNRGFCGGYNANLLRSAMRLIGANDKSDIGTDFYVVGKKGVNYFKFLGRDLHRTYPELPDAPSYADVELIANSFMDAFAAQRYRKVHVVYMRFLTASRQQPETVQLLPIEPEESESASGSGGQIQYDFSPPPSELLSELLPVTVRVRVLQYFNDAVVSENVARMVAMKSATDAATDMIKDLSQQYNRARQSQITLELLDIMGGAEALK